MKSKRISLISLFLVAALSVLLMGICACSADVTGTYEFSVAYKIVQYKGKTQKVEATDEYAEWFSAYNRRIVLNEDGTGKRYGDFDITWIKDGKSISISWYSSGSSTPNTDTYTYKNNSLVSSVAGWEVIYAKV